MKICTPASVWAWNAIKPFRPGKVAWARLTRALDQTSKLSLGWDNPEVGRPPTLGEHTEAVLTELGYSRERIAELKEKRAI